MTGKAILITGAGKRVGAVIARTVHADGASVFLHYRTARAEAEALRDELNAKRPDSAVAMQADLLQADTLAGLVEGAIRAFGRLDALVNNASSFFATPLGGIDETAWADLIGSNLKAPLFLAQAAAPHLRAAGGSIVNIVDIHAERPLKGYALYCAAKAGLAGLTRALALELAPEVRVNGIAPGTILWPEDGSFPPQAQQNVLSHTPLAREGSPDDLARTVRFLIADAPYVTGQILAVDGGRSLYL